MQCQDFDMSKSGETSQLSEDLSQIKFSINRIIISNPHFFHKLPEIDQSTLQDVESKMISLKLKFYSMLSGCKLKQKNTRVSILKNNSTPSDTYALTVQKDSINLKVSFPTNQEYEIIGKVYIYDETKSQQSDTQKIPVGTFQINLLEWTKQLRRQSESSQQQNPQSTSSLKKVNLKIYNPLQQTEMEHSINEDSFLVQGFHKDQTSETQQNNQFISCNHQMKSLHNFIQFKVLNGQFVENLFNHLNLENLQDLVPKQRKLKIFNSIIDEKIGKTHKIPYLTTRTSKFYLLPERQVLSNINRTKSEAFLQSLNTSERQQKTQRPNVQITLKRQPKTFKQQLYDLLQEVKNFKQSTKIERQSFERNASISRIKNIYYLMSPIRQEKNNQNYFYDHPLIQRTTNQFQELMPLSSVIQNSHSEISLSILQNDSISLNAKYRQALRVQERLESFQKMRSLSSKSLFKIQQSQEVSEKQIKPSNQPLVC